MPPIETRGSITIRRLKRPNLVPRLAFRCTCSSLQQVSAASDLWWAYYMWYWVPLHQSLLVWSLAKLESCQVGVLPSWSLAKLESCRAGIQAGVLSSWNLVRDESLYIYIWYRTVLGCISVGLELSTTTTPMLKVHSYQLTSQANQWNKPGILVSWYEVRQTGQDPVCSVSTWIPGVG